jgi:hypothetical protein
MSFCAARPLAELWVLSLPGMTMVGALIERSWSSVTPMMVKLAPAKNSLCQCSITAM